MSPLRAVGPVLLVLPCRAPTALEEGQAVWAHLGGGGRTAGRIQCLSQDLAAFAFGEVTAADPV